MLQLPARASMKAGNGNARDLGFTRPEQRIKIRQHGFRSGMTPALILTLQPIPLAALETLRDTSNLESELLAFGTGVDANGEQQVQVKWWAHVPRPDWIKKHGDAGARNILLLEVPLPIGTSPHEREGIAETLRRAEEQFRTGDCSTCVASCRTVIQELGLVVMRMGVLR